MDYLKKKREELEKKLKRREDAHDKKFVASINEAAYHTSCKEINDIYIMLSEVCKELGDPIPVRF